MKWKCVLQPCKQQKKKKWLLWVSFVCNLERFTEFVLCKSKQILLFVLTINWTLLNRVMCNDSYRSMTGFNIDTTPSKTLCILFFNMGDASVFFIFYKIVIKDVYSLLVRMKVLNLP
jgi:hypothetical protein